MSCKKNANRMKTRLGNKGFSLVELIIVIAIMAVMIGILAPQFLKYVTNARVSADVTNANEMAKFINAAVAGEYGASVPTLIQGAGGTSVSNVPGLEILPMCKLNGTYEWEITSSPTTGVISITLNTYTIYSDTNATNDYLEQYYVE